MNNKIMTLTNKYGYLALPFLLLIFVYSMAQVGYYIDNILNINPYPYGISAISNIIMSVSIAILIAFLQTVYRFKEMRT